MKNQVAVVVAIAFAILAVIATRAYMKGIQKQRQKEIVYVSVVTARRDIEPGEKLSEKNVTRGKTSKEVLYSMNLIPWAEVDRYLGTYTVQKKIPRGAFVTLDMLQKSGPRSLATELMPGERAITIAVDEVSGVSGYVTPGDHVDVYATFSVPVGKGRSGRTETKTVLLLRNVKVLKTGVKTTQAVFPFKKTSSRRTYRTVTLRLKEEEARILAFAQVKGRITLALRPPGDTTKPAGTVVDLQTIMHKYLQPVR